jgi:hypothetical protein
MQAPRWVLIWRSQGKKKLAAAVVLSVWNSGFGFTYYNINNTGRDPSPSKNGLSSPVCLCLLCTVYHRMACCDLGPKLNQKKIQTLRTQRGEARSTTRRHPTQYPRPGEAPDWLELPLADFTARSPPLLSKWQLLLQEVRHSAKRWIAVL